MHSLFSELKWYVLSMVPQRGTSLLDSAGKLHRTLPIKAGVAAVLICHSCDETEIKDRKTRNWNGSKQKCLCIESASQVAPKFYFCLIKSPIPVLDWGCKAWVACTVFMMVFLWSGNIQEQLSAVASFDESRLLRECCWNNRWVDGTTQCARGDVKRRLSRPITMPNNHLTCRDSRLENWL